MAECPTLMQPKGVHRSWTYSRAERDEEKDSNGIFHKGKDETFVLMLAFVSFLLFDSISFPSLLQQPMVFPPYYLILYKYILSDNRENMS